jgi:hypothetical protein
MINERETRIRKSWMELARAVIEDALEEKDSQFFLDPRSVFPELSKMARLPADDLLQYVRNNF